METLEIEDLKLLIKILDRKIAGLGTCIQTDQIIFEISSLSKSRDIFEQRLKDLGYNPLPF